MHHVWDFLYLCRVGAVSPTNNMKVITMARVLFINGGAEGHINPTLGVVHELVRRGEDVVYVTTEQFRNRIEAAGASVVTYDGSAFFEAFLGDGVFHLLARVTGLLRTADIVIPSVLEQIKGQHFDYIIHDSMFGCGRLFAQILNLPAVNSVTGFAFKEEAFDSLLATVSRHVSTEVNERVEREFQQMVQAVQAKYQVDIGSAYEVFCHPAPLSIVYTSKRFQQGGDSFDETYKFVGPSIAPRSQAAFDFTGVDTDHTCQGVCDTWRYEQYQ